MYNISFPFSVQMFPYIDPLGEIVLRAAEDEGTIVGYKVFSSI